MAEILLSGTVGAGRSKNGIPHNEPEDVVTIRNRFIELGFGHEVKKDGKMIDLLSQVTTGKEEAFIHVIKLFQCIYQGRSKLNGGDGRIDLHGTTHKWLAAKNAPGWVDMTGKSGIGWRVTSDLAFNGKNSFATTWMLDGIVAAGILYQTKALFVSNDPPMWIRDNSRKNGGKTSGHKSHQTGLDVDMRLPLLPPKTDEWFQLKEKTYDKYFHREAALAQVEAIKAAMNTKHIFFNDQEFIEKKLTTRQDNHSEHYHVRIKPPAREEGTSS